MKKTNKLFQYIAAYLVSKNMEFKFVKTYIETNKYTFHSDTDLDGKIWVERYYTDKWQPISNMDLLKTWLKDNV